MNWICYIIKWKEFLFTTAEDLFILSLMQKWSWVTVYKNQMTSVNMLFNVQTAWAHSLYCNIFSLLGLNSNAEDYCTVILKNWPKFLQSTLKSSSSLNALNVILEVTHPWPSFKIVELIQSAYNEDQWVCCNSISCEKTFLNLFAMLKHLIDHFLLCSISTQRVCAWMQKNLHQ